MKRKGLAVKIGIMLPFLAALSAGGYYLYDGYFNRVYKHCVIEAGDVEIMPQEFLRAANKPIAYDDGFDPASIDTRTPGDYTVYLKSEIFRYTSILTVEDTTAPEGTVNEVTSERGVRVEPISFIDSVSDVQKVEVSYAKEPDFDKSGVQEVSLLLTDASGNSSEYTSKLVIVPIKEEVTIEVGAAVPDWKEFLVDGGESGSISLVGDMDEIDTSIVGEYELKFLDSGSGADDARYYTAVLKVADTKPPVIKVKDVEAYTTSLLNAEDFIEEAEDETELAYSFETEPYMEKEGSQEVTVVATDMGGNTAKKSAKLSLNKDTEAPVISGAKDITVFQTWSISYRDGVTVTDNADKDIQLKINADSVNNKVIGVYPAVYSATDRAGNHTEVSVNVNVVEERYSEESVRTAASQVLAGITTPEMSDMDKLTAIYYWVRGNIKYTEMDIKDDWTKGAYYGLVLHKGDCYIYCMTSKALLDAAGIKNTVIDTVPLRYIHFWNLVDIGEGWRHFDTTPRTAGGVFLYWDDATITAYSNAHNNSHIYDRTRFPDIP